MFSFYQISFQLTFQLIQSAFLTSLVPLLFDLCKPEFKASYIQTVIPYFHIDVPRIPKNVPESIAVLRRSPAAPITRFAEKDWLEIVFINGST